ncbi:cytochrome P450 [Microbispora siamensis]|uniref:Cytochrome P450 n=1 Tax=Microbispora siamensis TaxID=564413 RepID=A0ABQ4GF98_9ACTN|nr:cytochrome P450 [Microbispora siamensis]GIH60106.1 cytochrome P450 [Microbispora siamensis]
MTAPLRLPAGLAHPFSPAGRSDPYPAYDWLRANDPVHFDVTSRMWLLTAHEHCASALRDPRFSAALGQRERVRDDDLPASMLTTDPPEHNRLRAPGMALLGPAAVRELADGIATVVDGLLDGLADAVEVTRDLGEPFATGVLARTLLLPREDEAAFADLARRASVNLDPLAGPQAAREGRVAMGELTRFLDAHVARGPGGSIGRLAADERLTRPEMLGILSLAVVGGWRPLAEMVGNALFWLLPRPEALAALREGGDDLARTAVDELLRLEAPIPFTARVTTAEVSFGDAVIPAGARVLAVVAAANRDPAVFDRPGDLVLTRSPNPHLAFGAGTHFCLGAPLVRQAGALLLRGLAERFPAIRPDGAPPAWAPVLVPRRLNEFRIRLS